ncbi:MAG: hypothetical protein ACTHJJ_15665 [Intrasporangium sp.]|uniref:hypothetical protein n=1 Tax=Intrasporangium sp. TaxID=1925024 RepID=UPI003F7EE6ED
MARLTYPSVQFPGGPRARLELPDGWEPLSVPGAVLAAIRPEPSDVFNPNIVVTSEPQEPGFDIMAVLDLLEGTAAERRGGEVGEPYEAIISGIDFVGRPLSFIDDQAGTVVQLHLFGLVPRSEAGAADLVHVTGTVGAAHAEQDYALVRDILRTLRVAPWTGSVDTEPETQPPRPDGRSGDATHDGSGNERSAP